MAAAERDALTGERYGSKSRRPAQTYSTVREISLETGIPKSSVVRIIRNVWLTLLYEFCDNFLIIFLAVKEF